MAYAWEEALHSLRRGRWALLLSMATIAVALTMLGAFRVVSDNVARVADGWRTAAEMTVYLDDVRDRDRADGGAAADRAQSGGGRRHLRHQGRGAGALRQPTSPNWAT